MEHLMQKNNISLIYTPHKNIKNFGKVFMQEVNTWEYIDDAIKKTSVIRKFRKGNFNDQYTSEIYPYENIKTDK